MARPVAAIVLAAGEGRRMGSAQNKVFLEIGGRPILAWSLQAFEASSQVEGIILVAGASYRRDCARLVERIGAGKVRRIVSGGATRQESEWQGLEAVRSSMGDEVIVLVHDAARPFPPRSLLEALIGAAEESGGAILALPAPPAVVAARDGLVTGYPADLWAAQTPQAFRLAEIMEAHERAKLEGFQATDTAVLYERVGGQVRVVESSADNIKVTIPADLALAEAIARRLRS